MSRESNRIARRREQNPVIECNKIQKRFYPELFVKFRETTDPRTSSYICYDNSVMLGSFYYKGIAGISSMQGMTREFNKESISEKCNLSMWITFLQ